MQKYASFDPLKFDLVEHLLEKDIADIVVADELPELPVQDVVEGEAGLSHTTKFLIIIKCQYYKT